MALLIIIIIELRVAEQWSSHINRSCLHSLRFASSNDWIHRKKKKSPIHSVSVCFWFRQVKKTNEETVFDKILHNDLRLGSSCVDSSRQRGTSSREAFVKSMRSQATACVFAVAICTLCNYCQVFSFFFFFFHVFSFGVRSIADRIQMKWI